MKGTPFGVISTNPSPLVSPFPMGCNWKLYAVTCAFPIGFVSKILLTAIHSLFSEFRFTIIPRLEAKTLQAAARSESI